MEFNFPPFWGLAIQAYESTLVSDQTPADRFFAGDNSAAERLGPGGPRRLPRPGAVPRPATSVPTCRTRPWRQRRGRRPDDDRHRPAGRHRLPQHRHAADGERSGPRRPRPRSATRCRRRAGRARRTDNVSGSFKVPQLRNVTLTAPYFHNGGQMTLRQVVDFYSRGGDFANAQQSGVLGTITLTETQKNDLVAFLQSLTDPRVATRPRRSTTRSCSCRRASRRAPTARCGRTPRARRSTASCRCRRPARAGRAAPAVPAFTGPCMTPPPLPGGAGTPAAAAPPASAAAAAAPAAAPRAQVAGHARPAGRRAASSRASPATR